MKTHQQRALGPHQSLPTELSRSQRCQDETGMEQIQSLGPGSHLGLTFRILWVSGCLLTQTHAYRKLVSTHREINPTQTQYVELTIK